MSKYENVSQLLVDTIQFLDREGYSNSVMRWKVDAVLNHRYSVNEMYEDLEDSIQNKKFIYGKIVTEDTK